MHSLSCNQICSSDRIRLFLWYGSKDHIYANTCRSDLLFRSTGAVSLCGIPRKSSHTFPSLSMAATCTDLNTDEISHLLRVIRKQKCIVYGLKCWNSLPSHITMMLTFYGFAMKLKTCMFSRYR